MNAVKMPKEREFTKGMISMYAQKNQHGFKYKEYPDLEDEVWEEIEGSKTKKGRWKISNMNRVKFITNHAENVMWGERLGHTVNGYPTVSINGKRCYCHILAFAAFHPMLKAKEGEMVLHEDDDKKDFRPHKLRLGTASVNGKDSHANGKRDGTKTARMKCASYINGILEKDDYISLIDAAEYLKSNGYPKASPSGISQALSDKYKCNIIYGRTWVKIM